MWELSPLKASNNVNGVGDVPREEALTLEHPALVAAQEAMVRKIVSELKEFDNLYYEICNEPVLRRRHPQWQRRIAATLQEAEAALPARHLIAENIGNGSCKIVDPNPAVSIFNFHYSNPPDSVALNAGLNRPIGFDETGFKAHMILPYRTMVGSSSWLVARSTITWTTPSRSPIRTARRTSRSHRVAAARRCAASFKILKQFIDSFDFIRMAPDNSIIQAHPPGSTPWALAETGKQYAIYLKGGSQGNLTLAIPPGRYEAEWLNPRTGEIDKHQVVAHEGPSLSLAAPAYSEDVALRLVASDR